jgi:hypothetical protein
MDKENTLLDGIGSAIWALLFGVVIFGIFRLLMVAYVYIAAIVWAILSELVWPLLRRMAGEIGIALLRTFNRLTH